MDQLRTPDSVNNSNILARPPRLESNTFAAHGKQLTSTGQLRPFQNKATHPSLPPSPHSISSNPYLVLPRPITRCCPSDQTETKKTKDQPLTRAVS